MDRFRLQNPVPVLDVGGHGREPSLSLLFCRMNQVIPRPLHLVKEGS